MLGLHQGLLDIGVESYLLTGGLVGEERNCIVHPADEVAVERSKVLVQELISNNRTLISNTYFSLDIEEVDLLSTPLLSNADIINLHWVSGAISTASLVRLASFGKPVVWTLHDVRPLTGGCHFPAGCRRFYDACGDCSQLLSDHFQMTRNSILSMTDALACLRPHIIAPSQWMLEHARSSRVSRELSSSCIPYGVDTELFKLGLKEEARSTLGLDPQADYILLASHNMLEKRKGVMEALEVLSALADEPDVALRLAEGSLRLLCCGEGAPDFSQTGWPVDQIGYRPVNEMPTVYQSATMMLFTSTEDNLPNVILEAMACGVVIVSHEVGGAVDLLGEEGGGELLFDRGNSKRGAELILRWLRDPLGRTVAGESLAVKSREHYGFANQARAYQGLYATLKQGQSFPSVISEESVASVESQRGFLDSLYEWVLKACDQRDKIAYLQHQTDLMGSYLDILHNCRWLKLGQIIGLVYKPKKNKL